MRRTILYGKIGRSMPLTLARCGTLGGDIEMTATLTALANRYPDDTFVLIGRNSGEHPLDVGLPENVYNPWHEWGDDCKRRIRELGFGVDLTTEQHLIVGEVIDSYAMKYFENADEIIMWVGQHGTSNHPIPKVKDRTILTKPQDAFAYYAGYLLRGINRWRDVDPIQREPIFLNADPRNYLKMRDLKHRLDHPVLTQYEFEHNIKHERYGDGGITGDVWHGKVLNTYSRLELNALMPGTPSGDLLRFNDTWEDREPFGIVINEARAIGVKYEKTRLHAMLNWVMPLAPSFVHGTWSDAAKLTISAEFGAFDPKPLPWDRYTDEMHRVRCTFTTPSSGSGWATTKPWEAFGLGVVCFFHPDYDTQDNILQDADHVLRNWLRVRTPQELHDRVYHLSTPAGRCDWIELVRLQKQHFDRNVHDPLFMKMIDDRLERRS